MEGSGGTTQWKEVGERLRGKVWHTQVVNFLFVLPWGDLFMQFDFNYIVDQVVRSTLAKGSFGAIEFPWHFVWGKCGV